jgi:hypothetical protein
VNGFNDRYDLLAVTISWAILEHSSSDPKNNGQSVGRVQQTLREGAGYDRIAMGPLIYNYSDKQGA